MSLNFNKQNLGDFKEQNYDNWFKGTDFTDVDYTSETGNTEKGAVSCFEAGDFSSFENDYAAQNAVNFFDEIKTASDFDETIDYDEIDFIGDSDYEE